MALFRDVVERSVYEDMKQARDIWQQECSALRAENMALMKDIVAMKRHELGLPPAGFEPKDPTAILGPRTLAAIEEMSTGYADVRSHNTNWAVTQANALKANGVEAEAADAEIAHQIRMGDTI